MKKLRAQILTHLQPRFQTTKIYAMNESYFSYLRHFHSSGSFIPVRSQFNMNPKGGNNPDL